MSNGDLDGDKYLIIWNRDILDAVPADQIETPCKNTPYDDLVEKFNIDDQEKPIEELFTFFL